MTDTNNQNQYYESIEVMITKCSCCGAKFRIKKEHEGKKVHCPKCKNIFRVKQNPTERTNSGKKSTLAEQLAICARCESPVSADNLLFYEDQNICNDCYKIMHIERLAKMAKVAPVCNMEISKQISGKWFSTGGVILLIASFLVLIVSVFIGKAAFVIGIILLVFGFMALLLGFVIKRLVYSYAWSMKASAVLCVISGIILLLIAILCFIVLNPIGFLPLLFGFLQLYNFKNLSKLSSKWKEFQIHALRYPTLVDEVTQLLKVTRKVTQRIKIKQQQTTWDGYLGQKYGLLKSQELNYIFFKREDLTAVQQMQQSNGMKVTVELKAGDNDLTGLMFSDDFDILQSWLSRSPRSSAKKLTPDEGDRFGLKVIFDVITQQFTYRTLIFTVVAIIIATLVVIFGLTIINEMEKSVIDSLQNPYDKPIRTQ